MYQPQKVRHKCIHETSMRVKTPPFDNMHILCGRGQQKYNCSGNKVLRQLVASHLQQYMTKSSLRTAKTKIVDTVTTKLFDMGMVFIAMKDGGGGHCWTTLNYADARKKVAHRFRDAARQVISGDQDDLISQQGTTSASLGFDSQDTASAVVSFAVDTDGLANTVSESSRNHDCNYHLVVTPAGQAGEVKGPGRRCYWC